MRLPILILSALLAGAPAWAENRGVVIWNETYRHAPDLPATDAADVAQSMRAAGFRTVSGKDPGVADLHKAVADLLRPDDDPGVRLVLLNGHFLHGGAETWLLAADAEQPDRIGIGAAGVSVPSVMDVLADGQPGSVLILGAGDQRPDAGAGLTAGVGELTPPPGVTVLVGGAAHAAQAAAGLLAPGASVGDVLRDAGGGLRMIAGGDESLILVPAAASPQPPAGDGDPVTDRAAWAATAAEDSATAYRHYLERFPRGLYSAAARNRLEQLQQVEAAATQDRDAWAAAAAANTAAAYQTYLSRFPAGQYADAAQRRLGELGVMQTDRPASQVDNAQIRETRLNLSRDARRAIQRNLNALGHATGGVDGILGSRSRQAIRDWQRANGFTASGYLDQDQITTLQRQAAARAAEREQQDRAYWERTGAQGSAQDLRSYLERYPNGLHAQQARARLAEIDARDRGQRDDNAFDQARRQNTIAAYDTYLRDWPEGRHAGQARENREALRRGGNRGNNRQTITPDDLLKLDPEAIIRELLR